MRAYALSAFGSGQIDLGGCARVNEADLTEFAYDPEATTIDTSVEDVFERRRGVCQDFAHLEIACLRSLAWQPATSADTSARKCSRINRGS